MKLITSKEDTTIAIEVLVQTYVNAPNISWMFAQTEINLRYFFGMLVKEAVEKRSAYLTSDQCGLLILEDMHARHFSFSTILRKLHLILFVLGVKHSFQIIRLNHIKKKIRPQKGFYGSMLVIKNHEFQWKTIFELKKEFTDMARNLGQPIYLETTNPRIFSLYKKLGFSPYYQMQHPYANINIYFMKMEVLSPG
jgi:hypothetical protein